jgi:hypothetical protein
VRVRQAEIELHRRARAAVVGPARHGELARGAASQAPASRRARAAPRVRVSDGQGASRSAGCACAVARRLCELGRDRHTRVQHGRPCGAPRPLRLADGHPVRGGEAGGAGGDRRRFAVRCMPMDVLPARLAPARAAAMSRSARRL